MGEIIIFVAVTTKNNDCMIMTIEEFDERADDLIRECVAVSKKERGDDLLSMYIDCFYDVWDFLVSVVPDFPMLSDLEEIKHLCRGERWGTFYVYAYELSRIIECSKSYFCMIA